MEAIAKGKRLITRKKDVGGDLLLRLFESEWFNSWICLQYLYQHPNSGVEDYLCNKLNELPEPSIEQYLLQFVYLAANRPGSALERTIIGLCSKSFVIAIKVHWLLLALCQDQKDKHLEAFRDKCERAALDGRWEVPFNNTHVENILSPQQSMLSPVTSGAYPNLSPTIKPPSHLVMGCSPPQSDSMPNSIMLATPGILSKIEEGVEGLPHGRSPRVSLSLPPSAGGKAEYEGDGAEDDLQDGPPDSLKLRMRMNLIRAELGEGEGVTALLDSSRGKGLIRVTEEELVLSDDEYGGMGAGCPLSPTTKVRHDAYGATLDFLEALCDTSFALVSIPLQEERQRALRHGLESINRDLNKQSRQNVAVWFPLGSCNERVLRIVSKEAVLLNSREKAPFMLFIEVLETGDTAATGHSQGPQKSFPNTPTRCSLDHDSLAHGGHRPAALPAAAAAAKDFTKDSAQSLVGAPSTPPPAHQHQHQQQQGLGQGSACAVPGGPAGGPATGGGAPATPARGSCGDARGGGAAAGAPGSHAAGLQGTEGRSSYAMVVSQGQPQQAQQQGSSASLGRPNSLVIPQRRQQASSRSGEEGRASARHLSNVDLQQPPQLVATSSGSSGSHITGSGITSAAAVAASGILSPPHPFQPQHQQSQLQHHHHQRETTSTLSSVVRSLCFSEPTADLPSSSTQAGAPPFSVAPLHVPPANTQSHGVHGLARFGWFDSGSNTLLPAGESARSGQPNSSGLASKSQAALTEEELQELMAAGCLSPSACEGPREKVLMSRMASVMASLRGEAPLVRLHLKVLDLPTPLPSHARQGSSPQRPRSPLGATESTPPPPKSASRRTGTPPRSGRFSGEVRSRRHVQERTDREGGKAEAAILEGSSGKGSERSVEKGERERERSTPMLSIGPISLGRRRSSPGASAFIAEREVAAAAAAAVAQGDASDGERQAVSGEFGSSPPGMLAQKSLSLLSRLGLCRRPTPGGMLGADSEDGEEGGGEMCRPNLRSRSSHSRPGTARAGAGHSSTQRRRPPRPERLVAVSLEVAGGLDLSIPSPYRKSRRTPSSEAISLVASKLKISSLPPPHHSGPPLNPPGAYLPTPPGAGDSVSERGGPWGSEVSTCVSEQGGTPGGPLQGSDKGEAGRGLGPAQVPFLPLPPSPPPSRSENFLTTAANFGSSLLSSAAAMAAAALGAGTASSSSALPTSQQGQDPQQLVSASSLSFQSGIGGGGSYWQHPPASSRNALHLQDSSLGPPSPYSGGIVSAAAAAEASPLHSPQLSHVHQVPPPPDTPLQRPSSGPPLELRPFAVPNCLPTPQQQQQQQQQRHQHRAEQLVLAPPLSPEGRSVSPPPQFPALSTGLQLPPSEAQLPPQQRQGYTEQQQGPGEAQPPMASSAFHMQASLPDEIRSSMPLGLIGDSNQPAEPPQGEGEVHLSSTTHQHQHQRTHRRSHGGGCRAAAAATAAAAAEAACLSSAQQPQGGGDGRDSGKPGQASPGGEVAKGHSSVFAANGLGLSMGNSPAASPGPAKYGAAAAATHPASPLGVQGNMGAGGVRCMAPPSSIPLGPAAEAARQEAWAVYGERWADKVERIKRESPHGQQKGWALRGIIVKSGDDCRQELLAVQLVHAFSEIFKDAGLPLRLRYYDVLVTSNRTALIEVVPDALSIHTVKHRSPYGASLSDHFFAKWPKGTPECVAAQRRLTESLAAYSIICYFLQIKDRHNGNILIDDQGCLVHIDFGFMLSNSPGGVNFEAAPFKLTREMLEVMDSNSEGKPSEMFDYFKVLVIQGFLACRKHHDRLLLMVRMMSRSGFPCFKQGERSVKALEKRFQLHLTEVQCVQSVLGLISDSLDAWRTRQYDYYQRLLNGIL